VASASPSARRTSPSSRCWPTPTSPASPATQIEAFLFALRIRRSGLFTLREVHDVHVPQSSFRIGKMAQNRRCEFHKRLGNISRGGVVLHA
jgi:hypothetical protein